MDEMVSCAGPNHVAGRSGHRKIWEQCNRQTSNEGTPNWVITNHVGSQEEARLCLESGDGSQVESASWGWAVAWASANEQNQECKNGRVPSRERVQHGAGAWLLSGRYWGITRGLGRERRHVKYDVQNMPGVCVRQNCSSGAALPSESRRGAEPPVVRGSRCTPTGNMLGHLFFRLVWKFSHADIYQATFCVFLNDLLHIVTDCSTVVSLQCVDLGGGILTLFCHFFFPSPFYFPSPFIHTYCFFSLLPGSPSFWFLSSLFYLLVI